MYVQYGCGFSAPEEWKNFDASLTLRWERTPIVGRWFTKNSRRFPANVAYGDIVKGLPVEEEICRGVYASHVLEHLALEEFHKALENTKRILAKDGVFRLVVPDLEWTAKEYGARIDARDPNANRFFMEETRLGEQKRPRGPLQFTYAFFTTARHMWMWDALSLERALADHGFHKIRRCSFGDCKDPMFNLVEDLGRFEHAVAIEAIR